MLPEALPDLNGTVFGREPGRGRAIGSARVDRACRPAARSPTIGSVAGTPGRMGRDVCPMARRGVGGIAVTDGGSSSAMPHESNPVGAGLVVTLARSAGGQAGLLVQSLVHERERSGAAWTLEWMVPPDLSRGALRALARAAGLAPRTGASGLHAPGPSVRRPTTCTRLEPRPCPRTERSPRAAPRRRPQRAGSPRRRMPWVRSGTALGEPWRGPGHGPFEWSGSRTASTSARGIVRQPGGVGGRGSVRRARSETTAARHGARADRLDPPRGRTLPSTAPASSGGCRPVRRLRSVRFRDLRCSDARSGAAGPSGARGGDDRPPAGRPRDGRASAPGGGR